MSSSDLSVGTTESTRNHHHNEKNDSKRSKKKNAGTGASAAGVRAVSAQLVAFYFRAPIKAFFRSRVDYMAFARAIHPQARSATKWSWRISTPGLLMYAVQTYGWSFIPNQVIPPMLANVTIGAVLYTSYLHALGQLHEPSLYNSKRVYPPPPFHDTFMAGGIAGLVQAIVASPLDALQARFKTGDMLKGRYKTMWHYALYKLREIGLRGVFTGLPFSAVKDAPSYALFFSTFEYIKAQSYYASIGAMYARASRQDFNDPTPIRPHYMLEPVFLLTGGVVATFVHSAWQTPIFRMQEIFNGRIDALDRSMNLQKTTQNRWNVYLQALKSTVDRARLQARMGENPPGFWRWAYKGFFWTTLRQTPSTSAGLIVFEIVRRKYGTDQGGLINLGGKQFIL